MWGFWKVCLPYLLIKGKSHFPPPWSLQSYPWWPLDTTARSGYTDARDSAIRRDDWVDKAEWLGGSISRLDEPVGGLLTVTLAFIMKKEKIPAFKDGGSRHGEWSEWGRDDASERGFLNISQCCETDQRCPVWEGTSAPRFKVSESILPLFLYWS